MKGSVGSLTYKKISRYFLLILMLLNCKRAGRVFSQVHTFDWLRRPHWNPAQWILFIRCGGRGQSCSCRSLTSKASFLLLLAIGESSSRIHKTPIVPKQTVGLNFKRSAAFTLLQKRQVSELYFKKK